MVRRWYNRHGHESSVRVQPVPVAAGDRHSCLSSATRGRQGQDGAWREVDQGPRGGHAVRPPLRPALLPCRAARRNPDARVGRSKMCRIGLSLIRHPAHGMVLHCLDRIPSRVPDTPAARHDVRSRLGACGHACGCRFGSVPAALF